MSTETLDTKKDSKYSTYELPGRPAKVQVGTLGEDGKPVGTPVDAFIYLGGTGINNYSTAWGKQGRDKAGLINGDIVFLKWGDPKGYQIEIRYLPNCSSIDLEFQRDVKKLLKLQDKDSEIPMVVGLNDFDKIRDKVKILMLDHHYLNGSNVSRPPNMPIAFYNYDPKAKTAALTSERQLKRDAEDIVMACEFDDRSLQILATLFRIDIKQQDDVIYAELLESSDNFLHFLEVIDLYRKEYEGKLIKAKELGLIDYGIGNGLYLNKGDDKKETLLENVDSGKFKMQDFILKFYYKPLYYKAIEAVDFALTNYTESVLEK